MPKQCPTCQLTQPDDVVFCPADGARLIDAALPEADHARTFQATLHGVGGEQAAHLAAALQHAEDNPADATQAFDLSALAKVIQAAPPAVGPKTIPPIPKPIPRPSGASPVAAPPKTIPPIPKSALQSAAQPAQPVAAGIRPLPAAVRSSAVAPAPVASTTTLAQLLQKGPLPVNVAVGRVVDLAVLLGQARPTHAVTPAHVGYADAHGHGKPAWVASAQVDAVYAAQYLPPEPRAQWTAASDVYVLACVLFEAITGKPPFRGTTVDEIARKHTTAAAPAVRQIKQDADLPPGLELALQRGLKKRPGDRQATPAAFADAVGQAMREDDRSTTALDVSEAALLQHLLQGDAPPATSARPAAAAKPAKPAVQAIVPPAAPKPKTPATPEPAPEPPPPAKKTGLMVGLVVGAIAVLGGAAFVALHNSEQVAPPPPPSPDVQDAPDVQTAPDVQETPDVPAPDVQPDVPPDVPDVPEPEDKGKQRPVRKVEKPADKPVEKPAEKKPDEKPPEKKPPDNRPPVF